MELKIDKKQIDEAVQKAVEELKQNYIWIPKGMTNGEVLQALFPNSKFTKIGYGNIEFAVDGFVFGLTDRWLNAPYQKGGE